jgi:hypothetical protein
MGIRKGFFEEQLWSKNLNEESKLGLQTPKYHSFLQLPRLYKKGTTLL